MTWVVRRCGCRVPEDVDLNAMCRHDVQTEERLLARQIDNHPEPGGHHTFTLPQRRCLCGLVVGSPEYRSMVAPGWHIPLYRRYVGDVQISLAAQG